MTERERLKKLLAECINEPEKTCPMPEETTCDGCKYDMVHGACDMIGRYADYLLAHGVTLQPCYDEAMEKYKKCTDCPRYRECVKTADLRRKRGRCPYADRTHAPKERSNHE